MFSTLHVKMIMLLTGFQMSKNNCENGFLYVWINPYSIDPHTFVMALKIDLLIGWRCWWTDFVPEAIHIKPSSY